MNRFVIAAAAFAALTGAVALGGSRAEAMSPAPLGGVTQQTEEVRLVCSMKRVGHRLVRVCRDVRPHYHQPRHRGHRHGHRR